MTTKKRILTAALCMFAAFVCTAPAGAEFITIGITGEVDIAYEWDGFLGGAVQKGDIMTGAYTYDTSTPDSQRGPRDGQYLYHSPPFGIELKVGRLEFRTDPDNVNFRILMRNDYWRAGSDAPEDYVFIRSVNNLLSPIEVPIDHEIWLMLIGDSGAISCDALPATSPVLSDWSTASVTILRPSKPNQAQQFLIQGYWTDAFVIPEPATLALLGLGALALLRKRGRI
ncbi:MAG: PEP-CTERM sorting domain-containing protein [Phycisphaerales bacterium]|nr:MAG: PEP-CTERM sorting domain-containing protein [Phycisphaerales bacterium]